MRKELALSVVLIWLSAFNLFAQSLNDTIHIEEVITYGDYRKYQPGSKFEKIEISKANGDGTSIDQLIINHLPIYIKSNAGGKSTIRIRGTAPDHTSIIFGGINLNSITLGQSNVSSIPTFFFDRLEVQYGSSSTLNGSGAIGGAIYLGQQNSWTNGNRIDIKTIHGSFGEQLYGTKLYLGNGKFESVTKIFTFQKENNFPFDNAFHGNVTNRTPIRDIQHGAALKNDGLMQEFNYQFTPNEFIKTTIWLEEDWYQIQPSMPTNFKYKTSEELSNKHIRIWSSYKNENKALKYNIGAGYVHDYQLFDNILSQEIITDRFVADVSLKRSISDKIETKFGANYQFIVPNVYAYSSDVIESEQHLDLYFSYFYQPTKRFKTTLNLRQMLVSNYNAPFTPSIGAEYQVIKNGDHLLKATSSFNKNYRIPTFNDRFWGTQGNPNLKPEEGISSEAGLTYYFCNGTNHQTVKLDAFYLDVDNWIEWRNFGVWQAQNVQRVVSKGIEFQTISHIETGKLISEISINYTLNSAKVLESYDSGQAANFQLIYIPIHMGNINYTARYKKFNSYLNGIYTGARNTNYLGSKLPSNFLTNAGISYHNTYKNLKATFAFHANNLFNVHYQNEKYYAMPGRNFRISITLSINKIKQ